MSLFICSDFVCKDTKLRLTCNIPFPQPMFYFLLFLQAEVKLNTSEGNVVTDSARQIVTFAAKIR